MKKRIVGRIAALFLVLVVGLSACTPSARKEENNGDALTLTHWNGCENFVDLLRSEYPDMELELTSYAGANRTGYSWAQMRADDIPDVFITSQILDEELASEELMDLSSYDFINNFSTSTLDQIAIDGGVYLLPVNFVMYGIFYNKTLMEEYNWELPNDFEELETLCGEIEAEGLMPGVIGTQLTGNTFSAVFNLAKTSWLTTPEGMKWEKDFLAGDATAEGMWEGTMEYVQKYIDIGMFHTDPEDRGNSDIVSDYLGNRKAVFCTVVMIADSMELPNTGDTLGMMPYIGEDGTKNVYMYSPSSYIGISKRLAEPGNEDKLERAIQALELLYSPKGQAAFVNDQSPCVMGVLNNDTVPEDSMIYDAQQALRQGRAFPMTYAHWENVLADMGQAYKEWFRGENAMNGSKCIARMDELQSASLESSDKVYFCEAESDFTFEETAELVGKALGSSVGADAAIIPYCESGTGGRKLTAGITGRLYAGRINLEVSNTLCPGPIGEYAVMTMSGAQAKALAESGFPITTEDDESETQVFPYLLVTRGGEELEDDKTYQIAFLQQSYTEEVGETYQVQVKEGSIRDYVRKWLEEQKMVSPDGNPWE